MGISFQFAVVPLPSVNGFLDNLYVEMPGQRIRLAKGVMMLETEGAASIPHLRGLSLNITSLKEVDEATKGAFYELIEKGRTHQYVMLADRREELKRLRASFRRRGQQHIWGFLEVFLDNAEKVLEMFDDRAAVVIND